MSRPIEYLCQLDSGIIPIVDTTWSIEDSAFVSWFPLVNTAGIMSVASGGTALNTPYLMSMDGKRWEWLISTGGVITFQSSIPVATLTASDAVSALEDVDDVVWLLVVGLDGQLRITTETPLENKFYYPAIVVTFQVDDADDKFELHAIKPNTTMHRR